MRLSALGIALASITFLRGALAAGTLRPSAPSPAQFQSEIAASNSRIRDLLAAKKRWVAEVEAREPVTREEIQLLKKYDVLLQARYVDDDGDYQEGVEISGVDRDNINRLFSACLHWEPLAPRSAVSTNQARKTLSLGIDKLKDRASDESSPDEDDSSELQILSKQIRDEKNRVEQLVDQASDLGYKVDSKAIASPARTGL